MPSHPFPHPSRAKLHQAELSKSKDDKPLDTILSQELVGARVQEEAALRRAELTEKERDRIQRSLAEMQVGGSMGRGVVVPVVSCWGGPSSLG